MSEIRTSRQFIVDFLEKNKELMGDIETVMTNEGKIIDLGNMTDEEASEAASMFMRLGTPSRFGSLIKGK
jgi:hypothetical protein